jgi:5-formyltetrahydrofolate cyclo-ligase
MPRRDRSNQADPGAAGVRAAPGADSGDADLGGSDLPGADLSGADLAGAELAGSDPSGADLAAAKASLRARLLARRRDLSPEARTAAGRELRDAVLDLPEMQMAGTVAAYVSVGTEPDTGGLLFALWKRGTYVLLPVLLPDGDLDWASYEGPDSLAPGPRGLLEPTEPRRGVTAITSADLILVPAVAVDLAGRRLGRGGGSYDRALARVGAAIQTVALLYDGELLATVPTGAHDQPVRTAAVAGQGISRLR